MLTGALVEVCLDSSEICLGSGILKFSEPVVIGGTSLFEISVILRFLRRNQRIGRAPEVGQADVIGLVLSASDKGHAGQNQRGQQPFMEMSWRLGHR